MRPSSGRARGRGVDPGAVGRASGAEPWRVSLAGLVLGTALVWSAGLLGWWWAAVVVGFLAGSALRPRWPSWLVGVGSGLLGWAAPLALLAREAPVNATSGVAAALIGVGIGRAPLLLAVLLGGLLGLVGTWLGRAVVALVGRGARVGTTRAPLGRG